MLNSRCSSDKLRRTSCRGYQNLVVDQVEGEVKMSGRGRGRGKKPEVEEGGRERSDSSSSDSSLSSSSSTGSSPTNGGRKCNLAGKFV